MNLELRVNPSRSNHVSQPRLQLGDVSAETNKLLGVALQELRNVAVRFNCGETAQATISVAKLKSLLQR